MHCELFIADHFDTLASGKVLAVGLFTDRVVVLRPGQGAPEATAETPYAHELSLLLMLKDLPPGKHVSRMTVSPPGANKPPVELRLPELELPAGQSANLIVKLAPLLVPRAGDFEVNVHVGDERQTLTFEVRIDAALVAPKTDAVRKSQREAEITVTHGTVKQATRRRKLSR